jgi:hypothetical protein
VRRGVEQVEEARPEIGVSGSRAVVGIVDDVEVDGPVVARDEGEVEGIRSGSCAMLDGDGEMIAEATDVKGAVGPGVEVAGAPEGLAGVCPEAALLGVMDDEDGDIVLALHFPEEGEESGDLAGAVFIDAVEPDEGIEEQDAGTVGAEGTIDAGAIAVEIETERGSSDDIERDPCEVESAVEAETGKAELNVGGSVFRHVDEGRPRVVHGEATKAGGVTGNRQSQIQGKPAFATLGRAADDTDTGASPEGFDEPSALGPRIGEKRGPHDGEDVGIGGG